MKATHHGLNFETGGTLLRAINKVQGLKGPKLSWRNAKLNKGSAQARSLTLALKKTFKSEPVKSFQSIISSMT